MIHSAKSRQTFRKSRNNIHNAETVYNPAAQARANLLYQRGKARSYGNMHLQRHATEESSHEQQPF